MPDYAPHELMICRIAAAISDADERLVVLGSFTPLAYAAYMLAKLTHAPDTWMIGYNAIGIPPVELSFTGAEGAVYRSRLANGSFHENANLIHLGTRGLLECVSSAQIDGSGAINLSAIGAYDHPKVRLPGGAGAPEVVQNARAADVRQPGRFRHRAPDAGLGDRARQAGARWRGRAYRHPARRPAQGR
jgi:acyl CoA:acetate/3-ketoacid CoA transferase beta subunit